MQIQPFTQTAKTAARHRLTQTDTDLHGSDCLPKTAHKDNV